jgi:ribosomal protein S17
MRFEIACKKRPGMTLYSAHIHVVEETMCNIGNIVDARGCFPASGFQKFVDNMNKTL